MKELIVARTLGNGRGRVVVQQYPGSRLLSRPRRGMTLRCTTNEASAIRIVGADPIGFPIWAATRCPSAPQFFSLSGFQLIPSTVPESLHGVPQLPNPSLAAAEFMQEGFIFIGNASELPSPPLPFPEA